MDLSKAFDSLNKDELQTDLVSNKVTVKNSREEKKLGIILMANFSSPRILLALPKRRI